MPSVGDRLKRARERKNLKQTQVKERTGINNKTLSGYENGVSEPDLETLKKLAELYEVSVDWLTGMISHRDPETDQRDDIDKQILDELKRISPEDKDYFLNWIKRVPKKD